MKKALLAIAVIGLFTLYSVNQHQTLSAANMSPSITNTIVTNPAVATIPQTASNTYKDGSYIGDAADAYYGYVQVKATIQGGKISDVTFLQYPNDRRNSIEINTQAMPLLSQEAISVQNAQVDVISGATDTSQAFIQSLGSALAKAK